MTESGLVTMVPEFSIQSTGGKQVNLVDYRGKKLILYFYPKDNTPGCTQEGIDFRDYAEQFAELGVVVFGISRDSVKSHENFKAKQGFPFDLLSDHDEVLCGFFNVIKLKNMYGKQVRGIERSTFLINENGVLIKEWRKVRVTGHVAELLAFLQANG